MKAVKIFKRKVSIKTGTNEAELNKQKLEQKSVTLFNVKYPYLLLKEHRFTVLVVIYSHELVLHNGLRETLTQLRSEYWIVKARNFIKKV